VVDAVRRDIGNRVEGTPFQRLLERSEAVGNLKAVGEFADARRIDIDVHLSQREPWFPEYATHGTGRELFAGFRERVGRPDEGASVFAPSLPPQVVIA
jgi:hypothetical protein